MIIKFVDTETDAMNQVLPSAWREDSRPQDFKSLAITFIFCTIIDLFVNDKEIQ